MENKRITFPSLWRRWHTSSFHIIKKYMAAGMPFALILLKLEVKFESHLYRKHLSCRVCIFIIPILT